MSTALQDGITAAKAGNKAEAMQYLKQALAENPKDATAWLWISTLWDDPDKKRYCFQKVLGIDPNNRHALHGINSLAKSAVAPNPISQSYTPLQPQQSSQPYPSPQPQQSSQPYPSPQTQQSSQSYTQPSQSWQTPQPYPPHRLNK